MTPVRRATDGPFAALRAFVRRLRGTEVDDVALARASLRRRAMDARRLDDAALLAQYRAWSTEPASPERDEARVAIAAEAVRRAHGLEARDVQLLAALALARGAAVELATGEGKSLAGVLATAALAGRGVHIVTPNEYLAERDAAFADAALARLGLRARAVREKDEPSARRQAYRADVTYGAARAFAFDRLRDSVARHVFECVDPYAEAAIVDEIDAVLFDLSAQPFVLGTGVGGPDPWPERIRPLVERMREGIDYELDLAARRATLTEHGESAALARLAALGHLAADDVRFPGAGYVDAMRALAHGLDAAALFARDREYVVEGDEVVPIERSTGRLGVGRRFADGLHGALEAKERLPVRGRGRRVAELDVRSLFAGYRHLAGMSGTLGRLDDELDAEWELRVVRLEPHRASLRIDDARVFPTESEALDALIDTLAEAHATGRPVLVGTPNEREAGRVSSRLDARGIAHATLTARDHAREASIVVRAGALRAVTVATQVAGRGTDIRLGGPDEAEADNVRGLGGLRILSLGFGREARVDAQLRGRAGRGGDPGHATIFGSLEDAPVVAHAREAELADARTRAEVAPAAFGARAAALVARCQDREAERTSTRRRTAREYLGALEEQRAIVDGLRRAILHGRAAPGEAPADVSVVDGIWDRAELRARISDLLGGTGEAGRELGAMRRAGQGGVAPRAAVIDLYRTFGARLFADELPAERAAATEFAYERVVDSLRVQIERLLGAAEDFAEELVADAPEDLSDTEHARVCAAFERAFGARAMRATSATSSARAALAAALRRDARDAASARLSAGAAERMLRAFRTTSLAHLGAAFGEHLDETREFVTMADANRATRDPAKAFRLSTHRRFEQRLARARTAAVGMVLRAAVRGETSATQSPR